MLFLANGEMYKGEFYQNLRHGRGEWRAPREPDRQVGRGGGSRPRRRMVQRCPASQHGNSSFLVSESATVSY